MFDFFYNIISSFLDLLLSNPILLAANIVFLVFLFVSSFVSFFRYLSEGHNHGKSDDK